jgi:hypothetical protein
MGRRSAAVIVLAVLCGGAATTAPAARTAHISPAFITKATKVCAAIDADLNHALGPFPYPRFDPAKPDRKTLVLVGKHFAKALPVRRTIPRPAACAR